MTDHRSTGTQDGFSEVFEVGRVEAARTFPLRRRVLRPYQSLEQMARAGDDFPETGNYVAFSDGEVIGTATVRREAPPWIVDARSDVRSMWRLRGMATAEEWRNRGVGTAVLAAVIDHVGSHGAGLLWCQARTPAVPFYRRAGFRSHGDTWIDPDIGSHIAMEQWLDATTR